MKNPKRLSFLSAGTVVALLLSLFVTQGASAESSSSFEDEEILRGIVFNEGPVADSLGTTIDVEEHGLTEEEVAENQAIRETIYQDLIAIEGIDETLDQLRSGDPYLVDEALLTLSAESLNSVETHYPDYAASIEAEPACGAFVVCVAAVTMVLAAGGAIVVVVAAGGAAAVGGYIATWAHDDSQSMDQFSQEAQELDRGLVVENITSTLAE